MDSTAILGLLVVTVAGLAMGSVAWPIKLMRKFGFEQWFIIMMLVGLVAMPWLITLALCPTAMEAYRTVPIGTLIRSNLFAFCWGIANILMGVCFIRIGAGLTFAILTGVGASLGVTMPMVLKGSGLFSGAADLGSQAGLTVLAGVAVMLTGVALVAQAGFGRDRALQKMEQPSGNFLGGLIMCLTAGVLSAGISFAFVYGQAPIVEAIKGQGGGDIVQNSAVWAVGLLGGALVCVLYPAYLLTKNRSWNVLAQSPKEIGLAVIIGVQFYVAIAMMGKGMLLLGALGASVGFGIQQSAQIVGAQALAFISGEWRGVTGQPRRLMYVAIVVLMIAASIMAVGNVMPKH